MLFTRTDGRWVLPLLCFDTKRQIFSATNPPPRLSTPREFGTPTKYQKVLIARGAENNLAILNDIWVERCGKLLTFPSKNGWETVWVRQRPSMNTYTNTNTSMRDWN